MPKKKKKIFHTIILLIGASLHSTANDCLLDRSSFQYRRFYFTTATTSITATATTTTATAPTRRPSLRDVCLATTTTERARVAAERSSRERTQKKRNDHHLLHTIPPPPNQLPPTTTTCSQLSGISPIFKDFLSISIYFYFFVFIFFLIFRIICSYYFGFIAVVSARNSACFSEDVISLLKGQIKEAFKLFLKSNF